MGTLFIVATPIGNLSDITLRAIETLKQVDLVVCEDTRVTGGLLHHLGIKKEMTVLSDVNEENVIYDLISKLEQGINIALVSDAGTPLISDPGFKLVRKTIEQGLKVEPIPGVSSVITALSVSGLPTDKFLFLGFPPDSLEKKKNFFKKVQASLMALTENKLNPTVVLFESPHKLLACLEAIEEIFGDIEITVAREMTKIHEEFLKEHVSNLKTHFKEVQPRGEFVILLRL